MRLIRGGQSPPTAFFRTTGRPLHRRGAPHEHLVEVTYPGGIDVAVLVSCDDERAVLRVALQNRLTTFAEHNSHVAHRISLHSTAGQPSGEYSFESVTRDDEGAYLISFVRNTYRTAVPIDLAVACTFGTDVVECAFTSMSAVGGTVRSPELAGHTVQPHVDFELAGRRFSFPGSIEAVHQELVSLAFRPFTSEPLEELAEILQVAPPLPGHLSLPYIAREVTRERTRLEPLVATSARTSGLSPAEPSRELVGEGEPTDEPVNLVMWGQLPAQQVVRSRRVGSGR